MQSAINYCTRIKLANDTKLCPLEFTIKNSVVREIGISSIGYLILLHEDSK